MILVILIVGAVATLASVGFAVSQALRPASKAALEAQLEPIDVAAFRNLIDPAEDEYLRQHLSAAQFRVTQRARLRARAAYVRVARRNAIVLNRMAQTALATRAPAPPTTFAFAKPRCDWATTRGCCSAMLSSPCCGLLPTGPGPIAARPLPAFSTATSV